MIWTFGASDMGWLPSGLWDAGGYLHDANPGGAPTFLITGLSVSVGPGDPFSCQVRLTATGTASGGTLAIRLRASGASNYVAAINIVVPDDPDEYDSGWQLISGAIDASDTINGMEIEFNYDLALISYPFESYADNVYLAESPPIPSELTHSAGGMPGAVLI